MHSKFRTLKKTCTFILLTGLFYKILKNMSAYINKCRQCEQFLTNRGKKTSLIVDRQKVCYSTDFLTQFMIKSNTELKKFELCQCLIEDLQCIKCSNYIGYHVVQVCIRCEVNDGRFVMLHNVIGLKTNVRLDQLPSFDKLFQYDLKQQTHKKNQQIWQKQQKQLQRQHKQQQKEQSYQKLNKIFKIQQILNTNTSEQLISLFDCPICLSVLDNAVIINCGHTFCSKCIRRHIDMKQCCPLDKIKMDRSGPFINNRLINSLIESKFVKKKVQNMMQANQIVVNEQEQNKEPPTNFSQNSSLVQEDESLNNFYSTGQNIVRTQEQMINELMDEIFQNYLNLSNGNPNQQIVPNSQHSDTDSNSQQYSQLDSNK